MRAKQQFVPAPLSRYNRADHCHTEVGGDIDEEDQPRARLLDYTGQLVIECPSPPKCKLLMWFKMLWEKLVGLSR